MSSRIHAWLQLVRLPNLFTVPGDPLVGLLLGAWSVGTLSPYWFSALIASLSLYAGGLILNDLMDFEEDTQERPQRPLPSGAVSKPAAWLAYVSLSFVGLLSLLLVGFPAFIIGVLLFLFIALYNVSSKNIPVFGPLTMGLCRGLSALLGAAMLTDPLQLTYGNVAYFQILVIYIGLVTMLGNYETRKKSPRWLGILPVFTLLGACIALPLCIKNHSLSQNIAFSLLALLMITVSFRVARCTFILARVHPEYIGRLVCLLIPLQAAAMTLSPFPRIGHSWFLLWPLTLILSKRFYVS